MLICACTSVLLHAQKGKGLVLELCHPDSFLQEEVQVQLVGPKGSMDTVMGCGKSILRLHQLDTGIYYLLTSTLDRGLYERKLKVYEEYYAKTFINLHETDSLQIVQAGDRRRFLNQFGTCNTRRKLLLHVTNAEQDGVIDITIRLLQTDTLVYGTFATYDGRANIIGPPEEAYLVQLSYVGSHTKSTTVNSRQDETQLCMDMDFFRFLNPVTVTDRMYSDVPFFDPFGQERARRSFLYREMPVLDLTGF